MKTRIIAFLSVLVLVSMVLAACGGQATEAPVVEEPAPAEPVEEPAPEEPVVEEPAPVVIEPAGAAELDSAFATFLADMEAYNTIGLDGLNQMLAESPPFLLDVRSLEEVEQNGHIEGSVVVPLRELGENLALLPAFDQPIVSYCGSGWRCTIALTALEALGWEDVRGLKGGSFSGWVEAGYPFVEGLPAEPVAMEAVETDPGMELLMTDVLAGIPEGWGGITADALNVELVENPDLVLIDVRRAEELDAKGQIEAENSIHIPLEDFVNDQAAWPTDLDAPVVVYCGSGHRSTIAMTILWSYGYTDVRSLKGGFGGWAGAGYPVLGGPVDLDTPYSTFLADMEAYNTIGVEAFNTAIVENPDVFILDVREPSELEENGHIEGAVNIPLRELGNNLDLLPAFDEQILSYCGSGWRCTIALTALEALGWEDVKCLKGGSFSGWVEAGYPVTPGLAPEPVALNAADPDPELLEVIDMTLEAVPQGFGGIAAEALNTELVENSDLVLIDVRRAEELDAKGVIESENFIHIPLEQFVAEKSLWPADKDATIVVYCGSGHRSTIAMTILWSYGYTDVRSLKGGFGGWAGAGYPILRGPADLTDAYGIFLADMEAYNTIGIEAFNTAIVEDPDVFILDVREPSELEENGHIEGAVNIPLRELGNNLDLLPAFDEPILSYCGSGWRCTIALTALEALGWEDVKCLKGGSFSGWVEAGYPVSPGLAPDGEVFDVVSPDETIYEVVDETLEAVPQGFGGIAADALNTELVENPDLILIDVRRTEELESNGVIESASFTHIPLEDLVAQQSLWPADKDATIVVYCGSGHRSTIAMTILWSYGYTDVRSLKGGFGGWADAGFPVVDYATVAP